jgi:hypothetical protein
MLTTTRVCLRWCALVGASLWLGCATKSPPPAPAPTPAELAAATAQAHAAFDVVQKRLSDRLMAEISRAGPVGAIRVCRDEAQPLTLEVAVKSAMALGRTSHRLRNPANAPRPWAREHVEASAGRPASEVAARTFDLGDRIGVLRPIPLGPLCVTCHGPVQSLAPEVRSALNAAYPQDQAVGFAPGELRGFFWAEVSRVAAP